MPSQPPTTYCITGGQLMPSQPLQHTVSQEANECQVNILQHTVSQEDNECQVNLLQHTVS